MPCPYERQRPVRWRGCCSCSASQAQSSRTRRVLPTPASPTIATSRGRRPDTVERYASCRHLSSFSLPTKAGRSPPTPRGRIRERARTSRRQTTPSGFPLAAIVSGSSNSKAPWTAVAARSPTRICPDVAASSSRAATLTMSPVTNELPSRARPTMTSPVFTPIRSATRSQTSSRGRRTECRHHRIARELLNRSTCPLDLGRHGVVEPVEKQARPLRILRVGERGRTDEVCEEDGCELAFLGRHLTLLDRSRTGGAETGVGRERCAALQTLGHRTILAGAARGRNAVNARTPALLRETRQGSFPNTVPAERPATRGRSLLGQGPVAGAGVGPPSATEKKAAGDKQEKQAAKSSTGPDPNTVCGSDRGRVCGEGAERLTKRRERVQLLEADR